MATKHKMYSDGSDPEIESFLGFLARDIAEHPECLQAIDASFIRRLQSLISGIEVDLDATLHR